MGHEVQNVNHGTHCEPDCPCPPTDPDQTEYCEGHIEGKAEGCLTISGVVRMEKCCCELVTRTMIIEVSPQQDVSFAAFLQATVNAYEANGYLVLGHSIVDSGGGWILGLTIGWYV